MSQISINRLRYEEYDSCHLETVDIDDMDRELANDLLLVILRKFSKDENIMAEIKSQTGLLSAKEIKPINNCHVTSPDLHLEIINSFNSDRFVISPNDPIPSYKLDRINDKTHIQAYINVELPSTIDEQIKAHLKKLHNAKLKKEAMKRKKAIAAARKLLQENS